MYIKKIIQNIMQEKINKRKKNKKKLCCSKVDYKIL